MTSHVHDVVAWRGIWRCTRCDAAWQLYRMIPAGSGIVLGVLR